MCLEAPLPFSGLPFCSLSPPVSCHQRPRLPTYSVSVHEISNVLLLLVPFSYPRHQKGDSETWDSGQIAEQLRYNAGLSWHDGARAGIKLFNPHLPLQLCTKLLFHHQKQSIPKMHTREENRYNNPWRSLVVICTPIFVKKQKEIASLYRQYQFKPTPGPRY